MKNYKFNEIYPLLLNKLLKKKHTKEELDTLIYYLFGYDTKMIDDLLNSDIEYLDFIKNAPRPNEKRLSIKGKICGINIEEIQDPLMRDMRILDKLVDDLAKGKDLNKILNNLFQE